VYRRHHSRALIEKARLFPGVLPLLKRLKAKGHILAVATNRPTRFSLILIRHLGIRPYFKHVLCADKLKKGKPHPEIILSIIKKASAAKEHTFFVGDMVIDAQAGRRAGVKTIIVTTGSSHKDEIRREKPYRVIARVSQLSRLV